VLHLVQQQYHDHNDNDADDEDARALRQPRIILPVLVLKLKRPSCLASVLLFLWPYIEIDTILLLPILLSCQLACLMVLFDV
jgi:hypothetical protein